MNGYSAANIFTSAQLEAFYLADDFVRAVPEGLDKGYTIRCHELARAVVAFLHERGHTRLEVVDGRFGAVDHSWLRFTYQPSEIGRNVLLDVYAVGSLPLVQLVYETKLFERQFRPGEVRTDIDDASVKRVLAAAREVLRIA